MCIFFRPAHFRKRVNVLAIRTSIGKRPAERTGRTDVSARWACSGGGRRAKNGRTCVQSSRKSSEAAERRDSEMLSPTAPLRTHSGALQVATRRSTRWLYARESRMHAHTRI